MFCARVARIEELGILSIIGTVYSNPHCFRRTTLVLQTLSSESYLDRSTNVSEPKVYDFWMVQSLRLAKTT